MSTLTKPGRCKVCRATFERSATGRRRLYCCDACRQRAHYRRQVRRAAVYHSRLSDEWATPPDYFEEWDREFGPFTLDAAATAENAVCEQFYTIEDDGLSQPWRGRVWCNPPYSQVARWVEKAHEAAEHGATVVLLVAARTSTIWWHEHVEPYAEIRFIKGRLRFSDATSPAPFGSALLVFRPK